jgi:hypothetical protein
MTTVFAGLDGGEGVGASKGRVWPGGGGGPGWPPDTGVRDATARWLLSCCECGGTLPVSAPALSVSAGASWLPPSPCAGGAGLASARGLAGGFSEAGLLAACCAHEKCFDRVLPKTKTFVFPTTRPESFFQNKNFCFDQNQFFCFGKNFFVFPKLFCFDQNYFVLTKTKLLCFGKNSLDGFREKQTFLFWEKQ